MTKDIASLRKQLQKEHETLKGGWRAVGRKHGITGAMAYRIANSGYEPKDPCARASLGLAVLAPAPVCKKCGIVHVTKRCTRERKTPTRWVDYPIKLLRAAIENRVEM